MARASVDSVKLSWGGKGPSVKMVMPDSSVEMVCLNWNNVDFARACIAQVDVDLLKEVIDNRGVYAPGNFEIYKEQGRINKRCIYCYAEYNTGKVTPRVVDKETKKTFEKQRPLVVRGGKNVECGHPYYYPVLMDFTEMCSEFGSGFILPTKMLPFGLEGALETREHARRGNPVVAELSRNLVRYRKGNVVESVEMLSGKEMAEKLRERRVFLHYSLGWESLDVESGAISQGFSNLWRIRQAVNYFLNGVPADLTLVADLAQSIDDNAKRGSVVREALEAREKYGIPLRLITVRADDKKTADKLLCRSWEEIKKGSRLEKVCDGKNLDGSDRYKDDFLEEKPIYRKKGKNTWIPAEMHPDFQNLVDEGVGVCGAVGDWEYCDFCRVDENLRQGFEGLVEGVSCCGEDYTFKDGLLRFHISKLAELDPEYARGLLEKKRARNWTKDKNQGKLRLEFEDE